MRLKGPRADSEPIAAFLVGASSGDQREHFLLARRQPTYVDRRIQRFNGTHPDTVVRSPRIDRIAAMRANGVSVRRLLGGFSDLLDDITDALNFAERAVRDQAQRSQSGSGSVDFS